MRFESLYVAVRGQLTKIGISWTPEQRMRRQQADMLWCSGPIENAAWIEYRACQVLRPRVVAGKREWFEAPPGLVLRVVRMVARTAAYRRDIDPLPDVETAIAMLRAGDAIPDVARAIGVSTSLIYQRARGEWAPRVAEGAGK